MHCSYFTGLKEILQRYYECTEDYTDTTFCHQFYCLLFILYSDFRDSEGILNAFEKFSQFAAFILRHEFVINYVNLELVEKNFVKRISCLDTFLKVAIKISHYNIQHCLINSQLFQIYKLEFFRFLDR